MWWNVSKLKWPCWWQKKATPTLKNNFLFFTNFFRFVFFFFFNKFLTIFLTWQNFKQKPQIQRFKLIPKSLATNPNPPIPQQSNTILNPDPRQIMIRGQQPQRKPDPIDPDPPVSNLLVSSSTSRDPASDSRRLVQWLIVSFFLRKMTNLTWMR